MSWGVNMCKDECMTRLHKYRAWDTAYDQMVHSNLVGEWKLFVTFGGVIGGYEIKNEECVHEREESCATYSNKRFIPMLFTGKYDIDGTEIYDCDIMEYCNLEKYPNHPNPYLVEWDSEEAGFKCENADNYMLASVWDEMRVIGNKHENPDLWEACK